jgi:hypothetical protein
MLKRINLKQTSLATLVCAMAVAYANAAPNSSVPGFKPAVVASTLRSRGYLTGPTANCSQAGSCEGESAPSQACTSAYDRLYQPGKEDLDFRIFVSYWDTQPEPAAPGMPPNPRTDAVIDHLVKDMFSDILQKDCFDGLFACGFKPEQESGNTRELEHLSKVIVGPDGQNRTVHLTLESSSVSDSDLKNHTDLKDEQKEQTKKVTADFFGSIGKAEVIIYTGHARWGTGPGFKAVPRKLTWSWFDQGILKPSRHRLEKTLKNATEKPSVIGYFACTSDKYYSKYLEKAAPDSGFALTEVATSDMESQTDALGTLNALLGLQCEDDFKTTLGFGADSPDAEIFDFFKPVP